jgi:methionyl aminopeptidase
VVREFCGHGIGRVFHEEPQVLHYGKPGTLEELVPGMTFTIEPMINAGRRDVKEFGNDGWTIVTKDHSLSAQWEHTVLVTETGYEVLTLSAGSPPPPPFVKGRNAAASRPRAGPFRRRRSATAIGRARRSCSTTPAPKAAPPARKGLLQA